MHLSVRPLVLAAALLPALALSPPILAQDAAPVWRHATSLMEEPKYPEGFTQFDYVNPDAPKGGTVRLSEMGSFDTFNPILPEGEAATGLGLVYETLMDSPMDEVSTQYGHIVEAVTWPDDYSSVTFRLDSRAHWWDGEPITADDVIWSFNTLMEINPNVAQYYANVTGVDSPVEGQVRFTFDTTGNRELPQILGQLLVLPQHWWEGTGADGQTRDIRRPTLEIPMGSGPYRIDTFSPGRTVSFKRVEDWWAADTPWGVGQNNFDEIRYEYFRDTTVMFEAFKGDQFDWWDENVARRWAREYDFPAVNDGRIVRELFEENYRSSGIMVGFVPNLRLEKFKDERVREALSYAFDFEELNRDLFFGQYERVNSYFFGTDLASSGLPQGKELEILESVRDLVPASVFTTEFVNPTGGDEVKARENLRRAAQLFAEAGWTIGSDGRLVNAAGEQFGFEILLNGPTIEPVALHLQRNLEALGAAVTVRTVDSAQYQERVGSRDYDVIYTGWAQSLSPGNEQRFYWGSGSATEDDTRNYASIADPGVDALIDKIIFAEDRDTLEAATRALDRVLLAHHFVLPTYTLRKSRIARWDRFGHPETLPYYAVGFPTVWWWDADKAAAVAAKQ